MNRKEINRISTQFRSSFVQMQINLKKMQESASAGAGAISKN